MFSGRCGNAADWGAATASGRASQADAGRAKAEAPNLRVTTTEVLVPTLVEKKGGGILYGLKPDDFVLEDNGVPQKIRVQEEMDTAPVALVVAVELGGVSVLEFDKLAKMGPLLDVFLSDPRSQVALVGFDSVPHLIAGLHALRRPGERGVAATAAGRRRRGHSGYGELRR